MFLFRKVSSSPTCKEKEINILLLQIPKNALAHTLCVLSALAFLSCQQVLVLYDVKLKPTENLVLFFLESLSRSKILKPPPNNKQTIPVAFSTSCARVWELEIKVFGFWGEYGHQAETERNWRKGPDQEWIIWVNTGKLTRSGHCEDWQIEELSFPLETARKPAGRSFCSPLRGTQLSVRPLVHQYKSLNCVAGVRTYTSQAPANICCSSD